MAASVSPVPCPFCSVEVTARQYAEAICIQLGLMPFEANAFRCLWKAHGNWVQRAQILDAIYADDVDGGPDDPGYLSYVIFKTMREIRRKIEPTMYRIENKPGQSGLWRIAAKPPVKKAVRHDTR